MGLPKYPCDKCKDPGPEKCHTTNCAAWRTWFIYSWNRARYRIMKLKFRDTKTVWRYEHPDLIREGIIWTGKENR